MMVGKVRAIHHQPKNETPSGGKSGNEGKGEKIDPHVSHAFSPERQRTDGWRICVRKGVEGVERCVRRDRIGKTTYHGWRHRFLGDLPFSFPRRCFGWR